VKVNTLQMEKHIPIHGDKGRREVMMIRLHKDSRNPEAEKHCNTKGDNDGKQRNLNSEVLIA